MTQPPVLSATRLAHLALRRRRLLHLESGQATRTEVLAFLTALSELGFTLAPADLPALPQSSPASLEVFLTAARQLLGAGAQHYPALHADFTRTVPAASEAELYGSALLHYLSASFGENWRPTEVRGIVEALRGTRCVELAGARTADLRDLADTLIGSSQPFSADDAADVVALDPYVTRLVPVPVKENLALLVAKQVGGQDWEGLLRTTTDVLRVAAELSEGDRSLTRPTRFRLPRRDRRRLIRLLEQVLQQGEWERHMGEMHRHREPWKRLLHCLHPQEQPAAERVNAVRHMIHRTPLVPAPRPPLSREEQIARLRVAGDPAALVDILSADPGDYARRLHALLRGRLEHRTELVAGFRAIAPQVSARVLVQMWNFFHSPREAEMPYRVVLTKRGGARGTFLRNTLHGEYADVIAAIEAGLAGRHAGTVLRVESDLQDALSSCAVPLGVRSAAAGKQALGRGSRVSLGDRPWVRLFLHWRNPPGRRVDLDLSAYLVGADLASARHISYTNLREPELGVYHSGDVVTAPEGAAEYIDLDLAAAQAAGIRYVVVLAYSYSRVAFAHLPEGQIGVMTRLDAHSGAHFEASEVVLRSDLTSASLALTPAVVDVARRELIWVDWALSVDPERQVNVENSASSLTVLLQSATQGRVMTVGEFLALTGAQLSADAERVLDPLHCETVAALIDC